MLGDEQRLEELENKLAALSSQVEGLELEKQIDPFFEEDVRRLINDFREQEIIESQDLDVTEVSAEGSDAVISVTTAIDAPFKLHWIKPESCEAMTEEKARAAFAAGVEERIGTAQSVQTGDVLILLCREPISEGSSSEDLPGSYCKFIGMAVDVLGNPNSKEPDAEDEHKITESAQSFEIFVWSSCECSGEDSSPVTIPSALEKGSTSQGGKYLTPFPGYKNESDTAEFLVSAEIRRDNVNDESEVAKTISNTIEFSETGAGYNTELVQLSDQLTEFYLDREKKDYTIKRDYGYFGENTFKIDNYSTESLSLKTAECGNLQAVSISGTGLDLFFLKEGPKNAEQFEFYWLHDQYLRNLVVSLGAAVSLSDSVAIESYRPITAPLENPLPEDESVFLPILETVNADKIKVTDDFNTRDISTVSLFTSDESDAPLKDSKIILTKSGSKKNFASGLLTEQEDISQVSINSLNFPVIDKEYVKNWQGLGVSGLNLLSSATTKDSDNWNVSIGISLKYENLGFESGLLNSVGNTVSLGNSVNIKIPKGATDNAVSIASDLSFTGLKKTITDEGVTVSLGASWNSHHSQFTDGLFKGDSVDVPHSSESSFDLEITDLVSLGNGGTAGSYIKQLKDLSGSGHYNDGGSMDLQLEFQELRSLLGFNDSGFYTGEISVSSTNSSVSINVPAMSMSTFPSLGQTDLVNVPKIAGLRLQSEANGFKLFATVDTTELSFTKGLFQQSSDSSAAEISLGSIDFSEPPEQYNPDGVSVFLSNIQTVSLSALTPVDDDSGTTHQLVLSPKNLSFESDSGIVKQFLLDSGSNNTVSIFVPKGNDFDGSVLLGNLSVSKEATTGGKTHTISLTPQKIDYEFDGGLVKTLAFSAGTAQQVSFFVPDLTTTVTTSLGTVSLYSDIKIVQNPTVEVIGQYDSIYADSATGEVVGDARYYVNYKADLYDTEFVSGRLKISDTYDTIENLLNGPIIVKGTRLRYGCDPDYGCIIDPAGDYDEPGCGSGCYEYEEEKPDPILTYRPSEAYLYEYYPDSNCYVYLHGYNLDVAAGGNDVSTQYYSNKITGNPGARYLARYDANDNVETVFQYDSGAGNYVDLSGAEVVRDLEVADELLCTRLEGTIIQEDKYGAPENVGFEESIVFAPLTTTRAININWDDDNVGDVLQVFTQKVNEAEIKIIDVEDYREPGNKGAEYNTVIELEPGTMKIRFNVFSKATEDTSWELSVDAFHPALDRPNSVYIYNYIGSLNCNYPVFQFSKISDGATDNVQYYEDSIGRRGKYELDGLDSVFYVEDNGAWVLPETIDNNYTLSTSVLDDACSSSDTLLSELLPLTYEQSSTNSISEYVYFQPRDTSSWIDVNFENYFNTYYVMGSVNFASTVVEITIYNLSGDYNTILKTESNLGTVAHDMLNQEFTSLWLPRGTFALNIKLTPSWRGSGSKVTIVES